MKLNTLNSALSLSNFVRPILRQYDGFDHNVRQLGLRQCATITMKL